ncbi:recombinase family protein, partial [Streptomyces sp. NPDC003952]
MKRTDLPAAPEGTASINIRLSKAARDENLSLDGMLNDARALCASMGLRIVAEHVDEESGAIRNRSGFLAWLDDAREGRASVLVAWHVDRMTREGVNVAALILDAIEGKDAETGRVVRAPVRLMDCKGLDSAGDETAFRFRFVIQAEVARAERERMRDRSTTMHARLRAAGKRAGGERPYGFRPDGSGCLEPDPAEAGFIREAAAQLLAGSAFSAVVRWANGPQGMAPRRTKAWSRVTLRQVLTITPRAVTEDVLTADERAALRKVLAPSPSSRSAGRAPSRLLSKQLRCLTCGLTERVATRSAGGVKDYICSAEPGACSARASIRADITDAFVEREFLRVHGADPE